MLDTSVSIWYYAIWLIFFVLNQCSCCTIQLLYQFPCASHFIHLRLFIFCFHTFSLFAPLLPCCALAMSRHRFHCFIIRQMFIEIMVSLLSLAHLRFVLHLSIHWILHEDVGCLCDFLCVPFSRLISACGIIGWLHSMSVRLCLYSWILSFVRK